MTNQKNRIVAKLQLIHLKIRKKTLFETNIHFETNNLRFSFRMGELELIHRVLGAIQQYNVHLGATIDANIVLLQAQPVSLCF